MRDYIISLIYTFFIVLLSIVAAMLGIFLPDATEVKILEEEDDDSSMKPTVLNALKIPAVAISTYW